MTAPGPFPRVVIAGAAGDAGKTLVSLAVLLMARERGLAAAAFKKGPDYIDPAWMTWASGRPARNLDTYLMGFPGAAAAFTRRALASGLNVIEGNRGLYDGVDARGTHSTAELAKALRAPVILVVNATKTTRTAAACVLGCQRLDPGVRIAGAVLNQVSTPRHERIVREAIEGDCAIPVLGAFPRVPAETLVTGRHLGLVTPEEHASLEQLRRNLLELASGRLDLERVWELASGAPALDQQAGAAAAQPDGRGLKIACLRDSAFTFYYPDNLEALEAAGAEVAPVAALSAAALPEDIDALYIGGGFPETHAAALAANQGFLGSIRAAARRGLPVYAECGGLMLLARAIRWQGRRYEVSGVLPFEVEMEAKPQGHGYTELVVDRPNAFFDTGARLRGHEFHYSRIVPEGELPPTACAVARGAGCYQRRDGVVLGNVWAAYTHLHALGTPEWAGGLLGAARRYRARGAPCAANGFDARAGGGAGDPLRR